MLMLNLNQTVAVKLTDHGRKLLRQNHVEFWASTGRPAPYEFKLPNEDAEGWSKWQLWSLMHEFGAHIHMGMQNPFDLTMRVFEDGDTPKVTPTVDPTWAAVKAMCK